MDSDLAVSNGCKGMVAAGTGHLDEAVNFYTRAIEEDDTNDAFYVGLASAYEKLGLPQKAEETYKKAIAEHPRYWANYNSLGAFLNAQGRFKDAIPMFIEVTKLVPDNARGYRNLGSALYQDGQTEQAFKAFEEALLHNPDYATFNNVGTAYFFEKRFDKVG